MNTAKPFALLREAKGLAGKRVLLRAGLNVPLVNGEVRNAFRIEKALPTMRFLKEAGAKTVVIAHIGRDAKETLEPVYRALQKETKKELDAKWCSAVTGGEAKAAIAALEDGDVLLLENLRQNQGETENDDALARELATYADIYVNDAFSVTHREHTSIVGVPKYLPAYAGLLFEEEYKHLSLSANPKPPSLFILGGAKFETKMPLVESYIGKYDHVFIGGALANDMFKARGYEVGVSMVSNVDLSDSSLLKNKKLILPVDVTVYGPHGKEVKLPEEVLKTETILDAGPKTIKLLEEHLRHVQTVLWNGPLGDYERGFCEQTEALAKVLVEAKCCSIVGGGDTIAAIESLGVSDKFDFVSTAGGAMLKFLEKGTLPGIEALSEGRPE